MKSHSNSAVHLLCQLDVEADRARKERPNQYETSPILSKTVLNFKLNFKLRYIGQFIAPLVFCNVFVLKLTETNVMGQKMATSEICTDLTEMTFFLIKQVKLNRHCQKLFCT